VVSRTFNDAGTGTYGQHVPAVPVGAALEPPDRGDLLQLREDPAFRTNLGLVNLDSASVRVRVVVLDELGVARGARVYELAAHEVRQHNRFLVDLAGGELVHATAVVSPEVGRVVAYASVVDNGTGDPVLVLPVLERP
jgi:hypothetical protein